MSRRSGSADLPLHGGRVPEWLAARMARLGRVVVEAIVLHHGRDEVLRRLSHPFWFQSLGAVMGMDWHSSGITTSVLSALRRGLSPVERELGLFVCGGRGRASRQTPAQLVSIGERTGLDGAALARASRLVAKVDSAAVHDGFALYLHGFIVSADGRWTVVQQGMNPEARQARRYHWRSEGLRDFVDEPHQGIEGPPQGQIVNLTDRRAAAARTASLALVDRGPDAVVAELARLRPRRMHSARTNQSTLTTETTGARATTPATLPLPYLGLPAHHQVAAADVVLRRLHGTLAAAAARGPRDFAELLLVPGVGARTVESLALVAEVVHGAPSRFTDPGRFSYAHGGKDGHPFPVPLAVYDQTLRFLRDAIARARLGQDDRLSALARLDAEARRLEAAAEGPSWDQLVDEQRRASYRLGGMTVAGPARPLSPAAAASQGTAAPSARSGVAARGRAPSTAQLALALATPPRPARH